MQTTADLGELQRIYRRVTLRVAPLMMLLYFVAFLDRVNIGFAALTMNRDLGINDTVYGLAAGVFFLGYLLLAVPSNCMLVRVGAPRWVALLMIVWGVVSCSMAFVHGPVAYIVLRFLLGAAESGFLPGVVFFLTQWLPGSQRGGIMGLLYMAIPLSSMIGSPVSAAILRMSGWHGLAGWQWLFVIEALPAVALGWAVPWLLDVGPATASWLGDRDKAALQAAMSAEALPSRQVKFETSSEKRLAPLALTYFALMIGLYELGFWTPKLLASHGVAISALGWLNAVPYAVGVAAILPWSRFSDRRRERRWMLVISFGWAAVGFAITALAPTTAVTLVGLSIAALGVFVSMPVFWAATSQRISVAAAAVSIAVINSVGNVGGFIGPYATGWLLGRTHAYAAGLIASSVALAIGAVLAGFAFAPIARER